MEYDVAIVGGGPAGLAAACYALQAQLRVALVTPTIGGKVSYPFQLRGLPAVESVRGTDLVQQFAAYVESRVTALVLQEAKHVTWCRNGEFQLTLENSELLTARALIVCTGAQPQRLYVPGEHEFIGRGVSFSAISHAQFFRNRNVAVVGGERALNAVLKLSTIAKRVDYILAREHELSDSPLVQRALSDPKILIFREWEVQQIIGDQYVTDLGLVAANGETRQLAVDGVFVELGLLPNNELVHELVELDEAGRIVVNHHCETNVPGLFAAGDVTNVYAEQVPVAIGEGVKAALSAWSYLALHK
jgi:alkyl hydroperoxide reductase subunit F